ncbi:MAG: GldG family protein [Defluviitaleaceae bacterium]|nr:GldG family protein [Defluviitaleaceae bacterium]
MKSRLQKFLKSFTNKKFRYGAFSTLMAIVVVAILVVINLVVGQMKVSIDMTSTQKYTISSQTKDILKNLNQDITIYTLFKTGTEKNSDISMSVQPYDNLMVSQILGQYAEMSPHITVVNKDPYLFPSFVSDITKSTDSVATNSLIVVCGDKSRVVNEADLISYQLNSSTYQYEVTSYDVEPEVTNAINYVTTDTVAEVYVMTGHGEFVIPDSLNKQITLAGFDIKTIDLSQNDMPDDCAVFIAVQPKTDWSQNEADKVTKYLQNNGKAMFLIGDPQAGDLPNIEKVLSYYGVQPGKYYITEANSNNYVPGYPTLLLPNFTSADAVSKLVSNKSYMVMAGATSVDSTSSPVPQTVTSVPLLTTSNQAYEKVNAQATTTAKEDGDISGPFNLAVAITDSFYTGTTQYTTKIIYCPCYSVLDDTIKGYFGGANYDFVVQSVMWLQGQTDNSVYVPSKSATTTIGTLSGMTQSTANMLFGISAVAFPVAVIVLGVVWWLRRRYS